MNGVPYNATNLSEKWPNHGTKKLSRDGSDLGSVSPMVALLLNYTGEVVLHRWRAFGVRSRAIYRILVDWQTIFAGGFLE